MRQVNAELNPSHRLDTSVQVRDFNFVEPFVKATEHDILRVLSYSLGFGSSGRVIDGQVGIKWAFWLRCGFLSNRQCLCVCFVCVCMVLIVKITKCLSISNNTALFCLYFESKLKSYFIAYI